MRKIIADILVLIVLLAAVPAAAAFIGTSDDKVKAVASPILDNLLTGFNQGNYDQYAKDFDATLHEAIPEKKFQQIRDEILKKLGPYKSRKYLGFLNQQAHTVVLWKGAFADTKDNVLIKLVLSKRENKVVVVGLWFQ
jgi:hypothetical protein